MPRDSTERPPSRPGTDEEEAPTADPSPAVEAPPNLGAIERRVWELLAEPKHADEITRALGVPVGELSRTLIMMEMKRLVRRLTGNIYERV